MAPAVWDRRSRATRIPYPAIGAGEAEQLVGTRPARFVCLQYSSLSAFPDSGLAFPALNPPDADLTATKKKELVFFQPVWHCQGRGTHGAPPTRVRQRGLVR